MNQQTKIKLFDEFSEPAAVEALVSELHLQTQSDRQYSLMEFCGGHTHALFRYGLKSLLPTNIRMIHGPGCPVCVLPRGRIDSVIELLERHPEIILCTYADLMRVPGSRQINFIKLKAQGKNIQMVYSPFDALVLAEKNPEKNIVFLAIGFETTAPATATALQMAKAKNTKNFFVYCLHLLTPPAVQQVIDAPDVRKMGSVVIDGFIGPGHVSAIIGSEPFEAFAKEYQKPVVIAGFTPVDMLQSLLMLVQMINLGQPQVMNQYTRSVSKKGNAKAKEILSQVFTLRNNFDWRGLGQVPSSAYQLSPSFKEFDAEIKFNIQDLQAKDHVACLCGHIIRGLKQPSDCKLFGKACTPDNPIGSCMVSSEGSCAAYFHYQPNNGSTP